MQTTHALAKCKCVLDSNNYSDGLTYTTRAMSPLAQPRSTLHTLFTRGRMYLLSAGWTDPKVEYDVCYAIRGKLLLFEALS